jgi:hypothetical protein
MLPVMTAGMTVTGVSGSPGSSPGKTVMPTGGEPGKAWRAQAQGVWF